MYTLPIILLKYWIFIICFDLYLNLHDTILVAHGLGGEVTVSTSSVPVALHGLGVEGDDHAELFGDAMQQETRHPQVIADADALAWAYLEFPLEQNKNVNITLYSPI